MVTDTTVLATLVYLVEGERTLMIHRDTRPDDLHYGKYNGLGGKFNPGESPLECARREVFEESGLTAKGFVFRGHILFPRFDRHGRDWLVFLYRAQGYEGQLKSVVDEGSLVWVQTASIPDLNLWEGDRYFLPRVFQDDAPVNGVFHYENGCLSHFILE
jgi:8-oxo-dGTP diphosphatase